MDASCLANLRARYMYATESVPSWTAHSQSTKMTYCPQRTPRLSPSFDSGQPSPAHLSLPPLSHSTLPYSYSRYCSPAKREKVLFYILPTYNRASRPLVESGKMSGSSNADSVPKPRSPLVRPKPLTPARPTPPNASSPSGTGSAGRNAGGDQAQAGSLEEHDPVDPQVLASAMADLNTLRNVKTPSASAAPSAATSPAASGASSPNPGGIPTHGMTQTVMLQGAGAPSGGVPMTLQMQPATQPPAPAVPGTSQQQQQGAVDVKMSRPSSAPGTPHFGAQTEM